MNGKFAPHTTLRLRGVLSSADVALNHALGQRGDTSPLKTPEQGASGPLQPRQGVDSSPPKGRGFLENLLKFLLKDLKDHRNTIKGPCGTCEKADHCYGCRGAAYQMTGDYLASDPLCWRNCQCNACDTPKTKVAGAGL